MTRLTDYWPKVARQCGPFHGLPKRSCTSDISMASDTFVDEQQQNFDDDDIDDSDDGGLMKIESNIATTIEVTCLLDLPDEVLAKIFSNLNLIELSRLATTSKDMCSKIIAYYVLCPGGPVRLIPREMRRNIVSGNVIPTLYTSIFHQIHW